MTAHQTESSSGLQTPPEKSGETPRLVSSSETGLRASNISKAYKKRPVLRNVSFNVNRGEAVGLLGPNGAGKTTSFYCITGLITPDTGTVSIDGIDVTSLPMYRRARLGIGYLPQEASIFRSLNVENNLRAVLEVVEPRWDRREEILEELLNEFSVAHLRRAPAMALSGGERRRVEIARALRRILHLFCWTSRWQALTRFRSAKSVIWSRI